jgi:hypothetical protein
MIDRVTGFWAKLNELSKTRWRWVGRLLVLGAFAYLAALVFYSGREIRGLPWKEALAACAAASGLYLLSLLVQYIPWARMLSFHHPVGWYDLMVFFKVLVLRRLPGGIWHWVGRTAMYSNSTRIPGKVVMLANFNEWGMLLLVAGAIILAGLEVLPPLARGAAALLSFGLAVGLGYFWRPAHSGAGQGIKNKPAALRFERLAESSFWALLYSLAWVSGGLIVFLFTRAAGDTQIGWLQAVWFWAVTGGSSLLLVFIPAGLGVREIALTLLLQPYLPPQPP